jgi:hypothetical protein
LSKLVIANAIAVEMADRSKRTGVNQDRWQMGGKTAVFNSAA